MDKIKIKDLVVFANHGVFPEENEMGQKFVISATLYTNTRPAGKMDHLEGSIDYGKASHIIYKCVKENTFKLIETVAETIAETLLINIDYLEKVDIEVKKPWAPIGLPLETASVEITRSWHTAYIAFGSNMGDSRALIEEAIEKLNTSNDIRVEKVSSIIVTAPYGGVEQDDFLNGCLKIKTILSPEELLEVLHSIEKEAGRTREIHWGPRTLDLDIIFYDDFIIGEDNLCIPHVDMQNRQFVLEPLMEIAPYMHHPCTKKTVKEMLDELNQRV